MSNATIFVKFTEIGFHSWPGAPKHREYLCHPHRHLFHVKVTTEVEHDDRQIEFHDLMDAARKWFTTYLQQMTWSCEQYARALATDLAGQYKQAFTVIVEEDGECGAIVDVAYPEI